MAEETRAAARYLTPRSDSFWLWQDNGAVLAWHDGTTIAFREQLQPVLETLAPRGLPAFNSIALVLAACRDSWSISADEMVTRLKIAGLPLRVEEQTDSLTATILTKAASGLNRIAALPWELRQSPRAKAVLCQLVLEEAPTVVGPRQASAIVALLDARLPEEITTPSAIWVHARHPLLDELAHLCRGLEHVDAERLQLRIRTSLDEIPLPAETELPLAERVRALLKELETDEELSGVARLAKQLMAAVTLPHALLAHEELPVGGVSDIVNRGPLDRLLLSELAHDDLTLAVRVALGEALYLRRESPPRTPPKERVVLMETGIRSWGVPRVFSTAVALALAATDDHHSEIAPLRAKGNDLEEVDLATREGLIAHLEALRPEMHPGESLDALRQHLLAQEDGAEPVFITTEDVLDDHEFVQALSTHGIAPLLIATVNRSGTLRLLERTPRGSKLIREAQLDLSDLVSEPQRSLPSLIDRDAAGGLPAIFAVRFPLRLSHSIDPGRILLAPGQGALAVTKDGRLMLWSTPGWGAEQLADDLPAKGPVHWIARPAYGHVDLAVGNPTDGQLHLIECDLENRAVRSFLAVVCNQTHSCVCSHGGALFAVGRTHVDVVSLASGQPIAKTAIPSGMSWQRERFFRQGMSGPWYALSFNGVAATWEKVLDQRAKNCPLLLTLFEQHASEGAMGVTFHGDLYSTATGNLRKVHHGLTGKIAVKAISIDGRRVVLEPAGGPSPTAKRSVVDVETLVVREIRGDLAAMTNPCPPIVYAKSLRSRIQQIFVDDHGALILETRKQYLAVQYDSRIKKIVLFGIGMVGAHVRKKLGFKEVKTGGPRGFELSVATWEDGSQAFLDSRGLLHLKSADPAIPEVSIVLCEYDLSGWCSDGRMWGDPYFIGDVPAAPSEEIFESCIRPFARRLIP